MDNNGIITTAEITPQERAALLDSRINANAKIAADSIVAVGRDLKAMRDEKLFLKLDCETFEDYCDKKTPIKQRQAYNFIKCYEKYGERLNELSNIGITKLTLMSALDDEDSERLIESGEAEELSTRELEKRIKELQNKNEQLTFELDEKNKEEKAIFSTFGRRGAQVALLAITNHFGSRRAKEAISFSKKIVKEIISQLMMLFGSVQSICPKRRRVSSCVLLM